MYTINKDLFYQMTNCENEKMVKMENEVLKKIERYLFEILIYIRISIILGIISGVYLIYTINNAKGYPVKNVPETTSNYTDISVVPFVAIVTIILFWVGVYLLGKKYHVKN
jgi:hypothetical protein